MGYTSTDLASYVGATILWTILSSFIVLYVWKKGLKGYSFYGR
jgi:hypothetical protein